MPQGHSLGQLSPWFPFFLLGKKELLLTCKTLLLHPNREKLLLLIQRFVLFVEKSLSPRCPPRSLLGQCGQQFQTPAETQILFRKRIAHVCVVLFLCCLFSQVCDSEVDVPSVPKTHM